MSSRCLVFSSDTHGGPLTADYGPYLESQFREDFNSFLQTKSLAQRFTPSDRKGWGDLDRRRVFATQMDKRLAILEEDGVVGEVIFPDGSQENAVPFTGVFGSRVGYSVEHEAAAM